MKGNIYWYDMQFSNYIYTEIVGMDSDGYEVYEYKISKGNIHAIHTIYSESMIDRVIDKSVDRRGGFRDAFAILFDAPKFTYIKFEDLDGISNIDVVIDRTGD